MCPDVFEATYQGEKVAVKTLKNIGEAEQQEFLSEAAVMTKLRHKNLVCLVGVVLKSKPIMIVSEFMSKVRGPAHTPSVGWLPRLPFLSPGRTSTPDLPPHAQVFILNAPWAHAFRLLTRRGMHVLWDAFVPSF